MVCINGIAIHQAFRPSAIISPGCPHAAPPLLSTIRPIQLPPPDEFQVPSTWDELQCLPIANLGALGLKPEVIGYLERAGVFFYGDLPTTVAGLLKLRGFEARWTVRKYCRRSHVDHLVSVLEKLRRLVAERRAVA